MTLDQEIEAVQRQIRELQIELETLLQCKEDVEE